MSGFRHDFVLANGTTISDGQHPWTETKQTALEIVSNTLHTTNTLGNDCDARFEADLASDDHWCEITISTFVGGSATIDASASPMVRYDPAVNTFYNCFVSKKTATDALFLYQEIAGVGTQIATTTTTFPSLPFKVRLSAYGSNITVSINSDMLLNIQNYAIPRGRRCGVQLARGNATADVNLSYWECADNNSFRPSDSTTMWRV